jgi:hypothetical protein
LDKEKWKHASLAQQNGFCPAFLYMMLRGSYKALQTLVDSYKAVDWLDSFIGPGGLLL